MPTWFSCREKIFARDRVEKRNTAAIISRALTGQLGNTWVAPSIASFFSSPTHAVKRDTERFSPLALQIDKLDPMQNQMCRVCDEPAAGFHFGAFTCEGCKSFFGRTCNNQSVIQECKNNYRCVINKKNRTACKACRLRKCLMVGMSKSGSRYGRRSNWFKIHCLMQQATGNRPPSVSTPSSMEPSPTLTAARNGTISSSSNISSPPLWRPLDSPSPKASSQQPRRSSPPHSPVANKMHSPSNAFNFLGLHHHHQQQMKTKEQPASAPITTTVASSPFSFPASLYSPFSSPLPFLPPTFNIPGLSALPLHKQALLSPLLASSHLLAAARKAYPFLPSTTSSSGSVVVQNADPVDVLAEHKALLERFRASAAAMAAAAALNNNKESSDDDKNGPSSPISRNGGVSPPLMGSTKEGGAMDLSKRSSSEDSVSSVGSEIIPNLSDTDDEELELETHSESQPAKRKPDEMPLDLTCV